MKSLLIICLSIFSFNVIAHTPISDIPVKKRKAVPIDNIFTFYSVSMQSADYEVKEYIESFQIKLAIELKLDGDQSENACYNNFILNMDNDDFEIADYKP